MINFLEEEKLYIKKYLSQTNLFINNEDRLLILDNLDIFTPKRIHKIYEHILVLEEYIKKIWDKLDKANIQKINSIITKKIIEINEKKEEEDLNLLFE